MSFVADLKTRTKLHSIHPFRVFTSQSNQLRTCPYTRLRMYKKIYKNKLIIGHMLWLVSIYPIGSIVLPAVNVILSGHFLIDGSLHIRHCY